MKLSRLFAVLAAGAFLVLSGLAAQANQNVKLDPAVHKLFMDAKGIQDRAVDRQTFNGRPVLVTFFASW